MFADTLPSWVNTTSARVGAGLGTIARVVASGEAIYRGKLPFAEAERRVRTLLAAVPRRARRADRRDPGRVRRLPADRLPLDAVARPCDAAGRQAGRLRAGRRARHRLRAARDPLRGGPADRTWATRCGATTPMPAAISPAITAGRARACMRCRSRSRAISIWMRARIERLPGFAAVQQRSSSRLHRRPRRGERPALGPRADGTRGQKNGGACGTAKFREETSKKADSAVRTALLRCTI